MQTVFSPRHAGHGGNLELMPGEIVPAFELPRRAEIVRARVEEVGLGPILPPDAHGLDAAARVHAPDYLESSSAPGTSGRRRGGRGRRCRSSGRCRGARRRAAERHRRAARLLRDGRRRHLRRRHLGGGEGEPRRRPDRGGAGRGRRSGRLRALPAARAGGEPPRRSDGRTPPISSATPKSAGPGAGEGFNLNLPLPHGTGSSVWSAALESACRAVAGFAPDALVVSLGVDTYRGDPISRFRQDRALP